MKFDKDIEKRIIEGLEKYAKNEVIELTNDDRIINKNIADNKSDNSDNESGEWTDDENQDINTETNYKFYYKYGTLIDDSDDEYNYIFPIQKQKKKSKTIFINFYNNDIIEAMKESTDIAEFYNPRPSISLENLYYCINNIRISLNKDKEQNTNKFKALIPVLKFIEYVMKNEIEKMDKMIAEGIIDYDSLWYYFDKEGTIYKVKRPSGKYICFKHQTFSYVSANNKDKSSIFKFNGECITINNKKLYISDYEYEIPEYKGTKQIASFDVTSEFDRTPFINNADKLLKYYKEVTLMHLKGKQICITNNDKIIYINRDERVIVDHENAEDQNGGVPYYYSINIEIDENELKDEDKLIIMPHVGIYNLGTQKVWGLVHIEDLHPIEYNDSAFENLVLEQNKKNMIMALIKNHDNTNEDFINTKGKGLVFLLHGPPGVGKTLSAEATAEFLKRPLFSINVGDLGTSPEYMEDYLDRIKQYITKWNAIILIDEVDIFLESREYSDIVRNSMVCIFLKFLEYQNNIIFLTTNRIKAMDPAIKSRINMLLAYSELDDEKRYQIWRVLTKKWNINVSDNILRSVSRHKINGREIRNYLRMIITMHKEQNIEITDKSFSRTLKECFEISEEFNEKVPDGMYV